jgi:hypothetical protein
MMPPMSGMGMSSGTGTVCGTTASANTFTITNVTDDDAGTKTGFPGGYREIKTNGCPGYDWTSQTTPNKAQEQSKTVKLPLSPKISTVPTLLGIKNIDGTTNTNPSKGAIGIAINGVSIYGNADATNGDAYINESKTFDKCGGHPQMQGDYHYHAEPGADCVFKNTAGQHSPLFGFMYDGIPIYGTLGDGGVVPTDLDSCGGHVDKANPFYHYHLPNGKAFPYTLTCLKGCVFQVQTGLSLATVTTTTCPKDTKQYDYSSLTTVATALPMAAVKSSSNFIAFNIIAAIFISLLI